MRFGFSFWLFGICILLQMNGVFADTVQDSLFEKALEAEDAGDAVQTIALLEMAREREGTHSEEIRQILSEYYDALGVSGTDVGEERRLHFFSKMELVGIYYKEFGDSLEASEFSGEGYLLLGVEYRRRFGGLQHTWAIRGMSNLFWHEDETVFDTSRWVFLPMLEYSLQGERFEVDAGAGVQFSDGNEAVFSGTLSGKFALYSQGNFQNGLELFSFFDENGRGRVKLGAYAENRPAKGFWANAVLSARFDRDTSVNAYFWYLKPPSDFPIPGEDAGFEFGNGFAGADSVRERYYYGSDKKLGPEIDGKIGYRFQKLFSLELWGNLFVAWNPEADEWKAAQEDFGGVPRWKNVTWNRKTLQGFFRLQGGIQGEVLGAYLSVGMFFHRFLDLPSGHPEYSADTYWIGDMRMGVSACF
ncbi:hypothetical protein [uncultured Fibrobacter sp.]|uniref:hypothetical protein n=1 Tax=uncultured Fibrobacter sp. TaxID=261512 RepID=UPI002804E6AC|nr:hypothetical protein [uncultured Fibrobacter sp.]